VSERTAPSDGWFVDEDGNVVPVKAGDPIPQDAEFTAAEPVEGEVES